MNSSKTTTTELGSAGEEIATHWLTQNHFEILERNARPGRYAELDLVAKGPSEGIHFVEVRSLTRSVSKLRRVDLDRLLTPVKRRNLVRSCKLWLHQQGLPEYEIKWQVDLIVVSLESKKVHYLGKII